MAPEVVSSPSEVDARSDVYAVGAVAYHLLTGSSVFTGQTAVEILDTSGQKHVVQRKDIASLEASQLSIMPIGFEATPPQDLKNLLEYLAQSHQ